MDSEATMAASSSGEGFWFSDSRNYHHHHHEPDHANMMMGVMDDEDQYGDEDTYLPYVYSMEGGDPGVNWEERCLELEMSLQRFRDQAGKIRGLLREKVQTRFFFAFSFVNWHHLPSDMKTGTRCHGIDFWWCGCRNIITKNKGIIKEKTGKRLFETLKLLCVAKVFWALH